jgi:hypothetical protein
MGIKFDDLELRRLQDKHEIASLILGTILISASKQRETKKTCVQTDHRWKFRVLTSNQHSNKPKMETAQFVHYISNTVR